MTAANVITFADLGSGDRVLVTDGYAGFNWRNYDFLNQKFEGNLYAYTGDRIGVPQSHSICAWGFQMEVADPTMLFRAYSLIMASVHPELTSSIMVKGFLGTNEVYRQYFNIGEQNTIVLNNSFINRLEFTTESADMFWANGVAITTETIAHPGPPKVSAVA